MKVVWEKYKKILGITLYVTAVVFLVFNAIILIQGIRFAYKYDFTYKIDYHEVTYQVDDPLFQGEAERPYPSFFYYYDENGQDPIIKQDLYRPYNNMNLQSFNLVTSMNLFLVIIMVSASIGAIHGFVKRYQPYGYLIACVLPLVTFTFTGWLDFWTVFIIAGLLISGYLIKISRFIDYNESMVPFIKKNANR